MSGALRTLVGAAIATLLAGCAGQLPSLEGLARIGQQALPIDPATEHEIGFGIAATVAGRYRLSTDAALTRYVNLVGLSVAQQSIRGGEVAFRFGVLDTDDVNAFTAPGGYVFVTHGALARMQSEAELAGVLAHEVAHVDQQHVLESIRRSAVFLQIRDEAQLQGSRLDSIAAFGTTALFTGLSRGDEMEADSLGVLYAEAAGYRRDGLLQFLRHLDAAEAAGSDGVQEWTSTHPRTADRIQAVERQMARRVDAGGGEGTARFRAAVPFARSGG